MLISIDLWVYFFIHRLTEALRLKNMSKCNVRNDGMTVSWSETDVYRRQILTTKVYPHAVRVNDVLQNFLIGP